MRTKELYKIKSEGRIAGVCAGVAEYFGIETWLVRIITVTSFLLLAPPFIVVGYVALWFILEDKSNVDADKLFSHDKSASEYEGKGYKNNSVNDSKVEVKSKVWQAGQPPRQALLDIKHRFTSVEQKLRKMESYVTSNEFQLNREINKL